MKLNTRGDKGAARLLIRKSTALLLGTAVFNLCLSPLDQADGAVPINSESQLSNAISAGASLTKLPPLEVPLNQIKKREFPQTNGCLLDVSVVSSHPLNLWPGDSKCTFGDVSSKNTVVLYGDSHAAIMINLFDKLGKTHHYKVILLAFGGCLTASIDHWSYQTQGPNFTCFEFTKDAIKHIKQIHPSAVLVADDYGSGNRNYANQLISNSAYSKAEVKTLKALKMSTTTVVRFGNSPDPINAKIDPVTCLSLNMSNLKNCNFSRSLTMRMLFPQAKQAANESGAQFVPLTDFFCSATICPLVVSNISVYFDPSHPSIHYYDLLSKLIDEKLNQFGFNRMRNREVIRLFYS
jgi:hypothetical protein